MAAELELDRRLDPDFDGVNPLQIPHESLAEVRVIEFALSLPRQTVDVITKKILGEPIDVVSGSKLDFVADDKLNAQMRGLARLDKAIEVGTNAVALGGLALSTLGLARRSPQLLAKGIGVLVGGLAMSKFPNIHNPASLIAGHRMGHIEDALQK